MDYDALVRVLAARTLQDRGSLVMPIRKFRSMEEMNQETWRQPGDAALYRSIAFVWNLGRRTRGHRFVPGVRKFTGIAAMKSQAKTSADRANS